MVKREVYELDLLLRAGAKYPNLLNDGSHRRLKRPLSLNAAISVLMAVMQASI